MKIGIITFHWATNYGAILQAFALQTTLQRMGHNVKIINYKPKQFDPSLWNFIRHRHFLHPQIYLLSLAKEKLLTHFREEFLNCTKRYYSLKQIQSECEDFDVLISGSDQVMNPSFLAFGEKRGSTAYFLDFGKSETIRLSYAVSFGTTHYPKSLLPIVTPLIRRFNAISVREVTGQTVLADMGRKDATIVPDPTLLLSSEDYDNFCALNKTKQNSISVYILHNRLAAIHSGLPKQNVNIITAESIEDWIQTIRNSAHLITNSFHGMVFAILYHVPFTVTLKTISNEGMNDRFFTLLDILGLSNRIMSEESYTIDNCVIDWQDVEQKLNCWRKCGLNFLNHALNTSIERPFLNSL